MTIEDSFGILVAKWQILHKTLGFNLETSINIVKCLICLHNFLITCELNNAEENKKYANEKLWNNFAWNRNIIETTQQESEENNGEENDCHSDEWKIRDILTSYFEIRKK